MIVRKFCQVCRRDVKMRPDGTFWWHMLVIGHPALGWCPNSGRTN